MYSWNKNRILLNKIHGISVFKKVLFFIEDNFSDLSIKRQLINITTCGLDFLANLSVLILMYAICYKKQPYSLTTTTFYIYNKIRTMFRVLYLKFAQNLNVVFIFYVNLKDIINKIIQLSKEISGLSTSKSTPFFNKYFLATVYVIYLYLSTTTTTINIYGGLWA